MGEMKEEKKNPEPVQLKKWAGTNAVFNKNNNNNKKNEERFVKHNSLQYVSVLVNVGSEIRLRHQVNHDIIIG